MGAFLGNMMRMSNPEKADYKHLVARNGTWHYIRRVPDRYKHVDSRKLIKKTLKTKSIDLARMRRDDLIQADDEYWLTLAIEAAEKGGVSTTTRDVEQRRYNAARLRAMAHGYRYLPADRLVVEESSEELVQRVEYLMKQSGPKKLAPASDLAAILGGTPEPVSEKIRVSDAFNVFLDEIAFDDVYNMSEKQKYSWEKTKRTSINYFTSEMGDLYLQDITRDHALAYRNWWMEKMIASEENPRPAKPNTANRHIGNVRTLYTRYFQHIGQEDRDNPFRNIFFKGETRTSRLVFENGWVQKKILVPGVFDDLSLDLRVIIYTLIETGARLSEIVNLMPEDIKLTHDVPHISIRPQQNRQLKTPDSEREVPLVGVALIAMQACPYGFEKYRDKGELVSANLMKAFRVRKLLPTSNHVIYSFRHAFEKRMLEAGIDYGLRCTLMGHKHDRPKYGDGGSMEYRRDELLKIVHPFSPKLFIS